MEQETAGERRQRQASSSRSPPASSPSLVGYTSSFAVVLTGLPPSGRPPRRPRPGCSSLCLTQAVGMIWLSRRYRIPLVLAWSTPGAALLAGTATLDGGWPVAVGAFLVAGAAYVLTGLWPALGRLIALHPRADRPGDAGRRRCSSCAWRPCGAVRDDPWAILPIVLVWLARRPVRAPLGRARRPSWPQAS